ncbi:hypothetical protein DTO271D3_3629 [Paecilomyces variotii]|nr:hypothetical protein DTO271D3_3629 [Paecilomyces variotii]KAJ9401348.1 hypothetical protein DTO282F9_1545 [Paecilomyces variotii]
MTVNEEGEIIHELYARKVVRVSEDRVVKSGPLFAHEADNLKFVAANTNIPVPKVHDVQWEDGKVKAITMDYMPGKRLDQAWDGMNSDQKLSVAQELRDYVSQIRAFKGDYIGGANHGKAIIGNRAFVDGGPFESEKLFNDFILADVIPQIPQLLKDYAKDAVKDGHNIVFTHGDLAPRNILVDDEGHVTAILDWELGGWYPEHWEYIKGHAHLRPMRDWPDYLSIILPPKYKTEYIGMSFLARISQS